MKVMSVLFLNFVFTNALKLQDREWQMYGVDGLTKGISKYISDVANPNEMGKFFNFVGGDWVAPPIRIPVSTPLIATPCNTVLINRVVQKDCAKHDSDRMYTASWSNDEAQHLTCNAGYVNVHQFVVASTSKAKFYESG